MQATMQPSAGADYFLAPMGMADNLPVRNVPSPNHLYGRTTTVTTPLARPFPPARLASNSTLPAFISKGLRRGRAAAAEEEA